MTIVTPEDVERVFADHPGRGGELWAVMLSLTADVLARLDWDPHAPGAKDRAHALLSKQHTINITCH